MGEKSSSEQLENMKGELRGQGAHSVQVNMQGFPGLRNPTV